MRFRHLDPGGDPTYPIWDSGIQPVTRSLFADFKAEMTALRAKDSYSHHGNLDGSWGAAIRDPTGPISASRVDPGSQFLVADLTAGTAAVSSKSEPLASLDSHHGDLEVSNPLSRVVEDRGLQASMQPWVTQAFGPQKARKATSSGLSHRGMPKCSVNYPKSLRQSNAGLLERPNPEGLSSNTHGVSSQSGPFHYQNPAILDGVILPVVTDPKGRPPSKGSSSSSQRLEEPPQLLPLGDDDPGVLDKYSRARPGPPLDQDSGPLRRRHTGRPGENNSPLPRARANDKRGTRDAPEQTPSRASGILHRETSVNTDTVASSGSSTDGDEGTASDDLDGRPRLADMAGDFRQQSIAARAQKRRRLTAAHDQPKASGINASRIPAGRRSYRRILTGGIGGMSFRTKHSLVTPPTELHLTDVALALNHVCSQTNRTLHCRGATATANFLYDRALLPFAPGANVVFLSHLIPKKYDISTRNRFLEIFKEQATYVPLCVMEARMPTLWGSATDVVWEIGEQLLDLSLKVQRQFRHALGPNGEGWPTTVAPGPQHPRALPVEIFEVIAENLPRDAVQNMRLVNHEFEKKISRFAFRSVVVPFKPKIYQTTTLVEEVKDIKGKGKEKEREIDAVEDCTRNERKPFGASYDPDTVHVQDGMRVFEQWGPEIKKFALTFEFGEGA